MSGIEKSSNLDTPQLTGRFQLSELCKKLSFPNRWGRVGVHRPPQHPLNDAAVRKSYPPLTLLPGQEWTDSGDA